MPEAASETAAESGRRKACTLLLSALWASHTHRTRCTGHSSPPWLLFGWDNDCLDPQQSISNALFDMLGFMIVCLPEHQHILLDSGQLLDFHNC